MRSGQQQDRVLQIVYAVAYFVSVELCAVNGEAGERKDPGQKLKKNKKNSAFRMTSMWRWVLFIQSQKQYFLGLHCT